MHYYITFLYFYQGFIGGAPDGIIWFATGGGGVSRYDGKEFVNFTTRDGLSNEFVICIYRDPDGILWVGTLGGGVCMYDGIAWSSLDSRDGMAGDHIWDIEPDPDGSMWFGASEGLTRYRRNTTSS
jgi:ligand-binding sensor domain-containing protein